MLFDDGLQEALDKWIRLEAGNRIVRDVLLHIWDAASEVGVVQVELCLSSPAASLVKAGNLCSVLQLVEGLLPPVKSANAGQVVRVRQQVRLDGHVKRTIRGQTRREVNFNQPRLEV